MKEVFKITSILTLTCVLSAFFLALVFNLAKEKIELNAKKRIEEAIVTLAPEAAEVDEITADGSIIYRLSRKKGELIGYGFLAEGEGYQGKIIILGIIDPLLAELKGIEILDSIETPGLGGRINDRSFKGQFNGLAVSPPIEYLKSEPKKQNQIKAITGATISSKAVVNILNKRIDNLRKQLERYK